MKRHYIYNDRDNVYHGFTACGKARIWLEPVDETKKRDKVSCGNCKKVLKARGKK